MMPVRKSQNWLPDVFNDFFDTNWMAPTNATAPAINVLEDEHNYKVEVAAPGMKKEDFHINLDEDNDLVISMEKKQESTEPKDKNNQAVHYLRREFNYSKFEQTLVLPENIQKDKISAKVENGVLSVNIPKMDEAVKKQNNRTISIA